MALINATWRVTLAGTILLDWDDFTEGEPRVERGFIADRVAILGGAAQTNLSRRNLSHTASFSRIRFFDNDFDARTFEREHTVSLSSAINDCVIQWRDTGVLDTLEDCVITSYRAHVENNLFMADYTLQGGNWVTDGFTPPIVPGRAACYYDPAYTIETIVGDVEEGMSFLSLLSGDLSRVSFWLAKTGSPTGDLTAKLYEHTGTYGTSSLPGALLATSNVVAASTLTSSIAEIHFNFSTTYPLIGGAHYIVTVASSAGDLTNILMARMTVPPGSYPGCEVEKNSSLTWVTETDEDHLFCVEVMTPPIPTTGTWRLVSVVGPPGGVTLQVKNSSGVWEDVWTYIASS